METVGFILVAGHLTNVCDTLFLHRSQTHRAVRFHALATIPMRLWLWLTTAIVTKEWVACHRKHHAFADREGDPHSPHNHHADPHSAKFKHKWYEFDIGWLYIRLLAAFGLAKVEYAHAQKA